MSQSLILIGKPAQDAFEPMRIRLESLGYADAVISYSTAVDLHLSRNGVGRRADRQ